MEATVLLPNSRTRTTPLGVGMATLMREPSAAVQQKLLYAAYDAGYRHFDVAPSYGLGAAERVLGRFLRSRPAGITIGTKVGIVARGNSGFVRMIQRPARALVRRFPALRGKATEAVGGVMHAAPDFSLATRTRSLEGSLRALGVETIDLYLLHEARPSDVGAELVDWIGTLKQRGLVRAVGIASPFESAARIVEAHPQLFDAVQVPRHLFEPASTSPAELAVSLRVIHSVLARPLVRVRARLASDSAWGRAFSHAVGDDVASPGTIAKLLLAAALMENEGGIVLIGSSNADHLRAASASSGAFRPAQVEAGVRFLRSTLEHDATTS